MADKNEGPPPNKTRFRKTSVGEMEKEHNASLKQILEQMSVMREENKRSAEIMSENLNKNIQSMREEFRVEINDIKKSLDAVAEKVRSDVKTEINVIEKRVDKVMETLDDSKKSLEDLHSKMCNQEVVNKEVGRDLEHFSRMMELVGQKILDLEARGRRNNGVFHGIPEEEGEDSDKLAEKLCKEYTKTDIKVQRAHRIGAGKYGKIRPLIVLFLDYKDKELVKKCKSNMPRGVYFQDDIPKEVRDCRLILQREVNEAHLRGQKAWISYPARLIIDGREVKRITPNFIGGYGPDIVQNGGGEQRGASNITSTEKGPYVSTQQIRHCVER